MGPASEKSLRRSGLLCCLRSVTKSPVEERDRGGGGVCMLGFCAPTMSSSSPSLPGASSAPSSCFLVNIPVTSPPKRGILFLNRFSFPFSRCSRALQSVLSSSLILQRRLAISPSRKERVTLALSGPQYDSSTSLLAALEDPYHPKGGYGCGQFRMGHLHSKSGQGIAGHPSAYRKIRGPGRSRRCSSAATVFRSAHQRSLRCHGGSPPPVWADPSALTTFSDPVPSQRQGFCPDCESLVVR